jgi:hypothetical protein
MKFLVNLTYAVEVEASAIEHAVSRAKAEIHRYYIADRPFPSVIEAYVRPMSVDEEKIDGKECNLAT